jgi:endonuclease YncB( thermonuclease family)
MVKYFTHPIVILSLFFTPLTRGIWVKTGQIVVMDGDSFKIGKNSYRMLLIDAPEMAQNFGPESRRCLQNILNEKKQVLIEVHGLDMYKRTLAHLDFVTKELVSRGCVHLYDYAKFESRLERIIYLQLLQTAKNNRRGLWAQNRVLRPSFFRKKKKNIKSEKKNN